MKKILLLIRKENSEYSNMCYVNAIEEFSGEVVLIFESDSKEKIDSKLKIVDGILLPGGDDVGPWDYYLIEYAIKNKLSLLGICQGMQSMALYGTDKSLISIGNDSHKCEEGYAHDVNLKDGYLKRIYGKDKISVNSHHRQTVDLSKFFKIVGYSEDNLIEAVEGNDSFQIGVQWHPERMLSYDSDSRKLFSEFMK